MKEKKTKSSSPAIHEEFFEQTNVVLFLNAEADDATDALASVYQTSAVERDIAETETQFTGVNAIVAQPSGTGWSVIFQNPGYLNRGLFSPKAGRALSKSSGRLAMLILSEDCSGAMDYEIFAKGRSVERFASEELIFRSTLDRRLSPAQLTKINPYEWINHVLEEINARLPLAFPSCTDTHCQLHVSDSNEWEKINAMSLAGDDLPAENFTTQ